MSLRLPKWLTIIAAGSMLDVHDTFLSEMMFTRELLQNGRSKELLILLAASRSRCGSSLARRSISRRQSNWTGRT
jgi:hypothetical protein